MLKPSRTNTGATRQYQSAIVAVGTPVTLGTPAETLDLDSPHSFAGIELFADAAGATPAAASAGTFTVTVKTSVNPQGYDTVDGGTIDATALSTASWDAPTIGVLVTPTSAAGAATYYRVNVHQRNR